VDAAIVLLDPEIYDRISDDNSPTREEWELPDIDYWGGFIDGALASVHIEHDFRDGKKIHFQVSRGQAVLSDTDLFYDNDQFR
jgi:hypothetical protein